MRKTIVGQKPFTSAVKIRRHLLWVLAAVLQTATSWERWPKKFIEKKLQNFLNPKIHVEVFCSCHRQVHNTAFHTDPKQIHGSYNWMLMLAYVSQWPLKIECTLSDGVCSLYSCSTTVIVMDIHRKHFRFFWIVKSNISLCCFKQNRYFIISVA